MTKVFLSLMLTAALSLSLSAADQPTGNGKPRDITTISGKVYKNVTIASVTPMGFDIIYKKPDGTVKIKELLFKDLPDSIRKEFNYDEKKAFAFEAGVTKVRQERVKEAAIARQARIKAMKKEAKDESFLESEVYGGRAFITLKVLKNVGNGVIGYATPMDEDVTTQNIPQIFLLGVSMDDDAQWEGYVYPTGGHYENYEEFCTSPYEAMSLMSGNLAAAKQIPRPVKNK